MANFHKFLVEHAKFPFPISEELESPSPTNISSFEIGILEREWKATHALRDDSLLQNLCDSLQNILGDTVLDADTQNRLLGCFSPRLQSIFRGVDEDWSSNPSEAHSRALLEKGVYRAAQGCLWLYHNHRFRIDRKCLAEGTSSTVNYILLVDEEAKALCEVTSPSVMKTLGKLLPPHGIKLKWARGQSVVPGIFSQAALYLGLRKMEWLFLTCHNHWIIFRLVQDNNHPFLAYSPMVSIENSSKPFLAFLGCVLSGAQGTAVAPSPFKLDMLDDIKEGNSLSEGDIDDGSGYNNAETGLMITSSSPNSPKPFQVWVHLCASLNNTLALPVPNRTGKQCLWLTHFLGFGSTGRVWKCHFDNNNGLYAIKIVELLCASSTDSRERLLNEFKVYLILEAAYQSKQLHDRITPRCYGAFEGNGVDALILDLCDGVLNSWDGLSASERAQVYKMAQDLHHIGIEHGDLEPRNVMRLGGGFCLIDFSQSRKHNCKEKTVGQPHSHATVVCSELQALQKSLWK